MKKKIDRREFLKLAGLTTVAAAVASCSSTEKTAESGSGKKVPGKMTMRHNASTGDDVSILGYGCMRLPTVAGTDGEIDQEAVNASVDEAMAAGVNYYDTSPAYCKGQSESAMGKALSRHPREKYFIATKLSNFAPETWPREKSIEMYRNSLKNLQTDYIDYMLLHAIGMNGHEAFEGRYINNGMLDFLKEERRAGRIRNLGFSYHGDVTVFDRLLKMQDDGEIKWDFAQIQHNYVDWENAKTVNERNTNSSYLYAELEKRGIPAVVMEPLLGGRLASATNNIVAKMKERRPDDTIASWAFRFAASQPNILTVLSGMTYIDHLRDNVATYSPLEPITEEEHQFLQEVTHLMLDFSIVPCTACLYCMPCPYGINIPAIFAHYNRCINEGNVSAAPENSSEYKRARRAFLVGMDRSVPRLRQAQHCIDCGQCKPHCPQFINIPKRLHEIDQYAEGLRRSAGNERV